jgi:hypothetical protein
MDTFSIIDLLQKYIGVIGVTFFASFFKKSLTTSLFKKGLSENP